MTVGTIARLLRPCLNNPKGSVGVCYETYNIGHRGYAFIFANGEYDGFSDDHVPLFLEEIGFSTVVANYSFVSVMRLADDFRKGVFADVFGRKK